MITPASERVPNRQLIAYSIGAVGSNVIYALIATYLLFFYTRASG